MDSNAHPPHHRDAMGTLSLLQGTISPL